MDFLFEPEVQGIFDAFSAVFQIRIAFFDTLGRELRCGSSRRDSCAYCRLLRSRFGYEDACQELDRRECANAASREEARSYRCHGGLTEAVLPVRRGGDLLGFVMIGQFRTSEEIPPVLRDRTHPAGRSDKLREEYLAVPLLPTERLPHVLTLLGALVRHLSRPGLISRRSGQLLEQALELVRENLYREFPLPELAGRLNRSPGTISNLFRQQWGMSFKQTQISLRLEEARRLLQNGMSVKETARRCGYDDPFYFSRLFKKYCGHSPQASGSISTDRKDNDSHVR